MGTHTTGRHHAGPRVLVKKERASNIAGPSVLKRAIAPRSPDLAKGHSSAGAWTKGLASGLLGRVHTANRKTAPPTATCLPVWKRTLLGSRPPKFTLSARATMEGSPDAGVDAPRVPASPGQAPGLRPPGPTRGNGPPFGLTYRDPSPAPGPPHGPQPAALLPPARWTRGGRVRRPRARRWGQGRACIPGHFEGRPLPPESRGVGGGWVMGRRMPRPVPPPGSGAGLGRQVLRLAPHPSPRRPGPGPPGELLPGPKPPPRRAPRLPPRLPPGRDPGPRGRGLGPPAVPPGRRGSRRGEGAQGDTWCRRRAPGSGCRARAPHLAAAHDVRVLGQQIHHLPFAFVAPLRAEHHRHPVPSGPRPGTAAVAVGQRGCCRAGLGQRHGSRDARRRGERQRVRERNCPAARSHMQRKRQPAAAPPRPRPRRAAPSSRAPPRAPPRPAQGGTGTAPRRPAAAAPPAGRGPGGRNRRRPEPKPRPP